MRMFLDFVYSENVTIDFSSLSRFASDFDKKYPNLGLGMGWKVKQLKEAVQTFRDFVIENQDKISELLGEDPIIRKIELNSMYGKMYNKKGESE